MKKLYFVMALLIVASMVLTACGGGAPATVTQADCVKAEVFCVGLVTDVGKVNDKSFNQSAWEGVQKAQTDGSADLVQYIETSDAKDYAKNIATFGDAGFDVIVTVGFGLGEATLAAGADLSRHQVHRRGSIPSLAVHR